MDAIAHKPVDVTEDSFDEAINTGLVLVDFWAPWCGPCHAIGPTLVELAAEYGDRLKIAKLNVDQHSKIAERYAVRAIPTLILFRDGRVVETMIGVRTKSGLRAVIEQHLAR